MTVWWKITSRAVGCARDVGAYVIHSVWPELLPAAEVGAAATASVGTRRPRPPRLIWPPLRPAARASSAVHSCAVPFSCAARPPLLAISRCFSGDMEANPRRSLRTPSTALLLDTRSPPASHVAATRNLAGLAHCGKPGGHTATRRVPARQNAP